MRVTRSIESAQQFPDQVTISWSNQSTNFWIELCNFQMEAKV